MIKDYLFLYNFKHINTKHTEAIVSFVIPKMCMHVFNISMFIINSCILFPPLLTNDKPLTNNSQIGDIHNVW